MEEWKEYKATEFCQTVTDGTHDSPKPKDKGCYLITSKHLKDTGIDFNSANYISEEDYIKIIARSKVEQYDILFSMIGTIGNTVQVKAEYVDFAVKNMGIFKMGKNRLKSSWLLYWLKSPCAHEYVSQRLAGSTQSYLTLSSLRNFPVLYPGDSKANKIVAILKSLDDKIEVNRRINDNLEQQAQALFRSWFVDFEPFRGQPFVESELGMIPEGWKVVSLDEACTKITDGSHFSPKDNLCGTIPMLSVKDMHHNGFDYSSCKMIDEVDYLKMEKNDCVPLFNDILVAKDGSYLKEIFICKEEKKQAILSSIAIFRSNPKIIYPDLLLQLLRLPKIKKDVGDNYVSGSALPRIVLKDFKKFKFVVPPVDIQEKTIGVYISINAQIEKNETESRRLAQLRDTLLPRLMSGELSVDGLKGQFAVSPGRCPGSKEHVSNKTAL